MVMARLHVICGNCGNGDKEEFKVDINVIAYPCGGDPPASVEIICKNCSTIHFLEEVFEAADL